MEFQEQKTSAAKEAKKASRGFREQRKTKPVRLSPKWHGWLKNITLKNHNTMAKRLDYICESFSKQNPELSIQTRAD